MTLDRHPLRRAGSATILLVCLMQVIEAALMLGRPEAIGATPLLAMFISLAAIGAPSIPLLAACLLAGSASATVGAVCHVGWPRLAILIPQNFLLGVMAYGGIAAAFHGHYLDGTVVPGAHIFADQLGMLTLFLAHTVAILERAGDPG